MGATSAFRLSDQQERLWIQQLDGASRFCSEIEVLLEGALDRARLRRAVQQAVGRHETLRTTFERQAGLKVPFQVIQENTEFDWQVESRPDGHRAEPVSAAGGSASQQDSGLQRMPVLRAVLTALAPEKHSLVITLPALCADRLSLGNLAREIASEYAGGAVGSDVLQYADIVEWQQELLASREAEAGREFWRNYWRKLDLATSGEVLLPLEKSGTAPFAPFTIAKTIGDTLLSRLTPVCSRYNASLEELLQTCWNVFLARLTGQSTITLGCEFDGRKFAELQGAVGLFAKYLPIQSAIDLTLPFRALVDQLRGRIAELRGWQESFAWNQVELPQTLDRNGLLPLAFEYGELPSKTESGGVGFRVLRQETCLERFKLKLSVRRGSDLELRFQFDAGRLEREDVERWAESFTVLLESLAEQPDAIAGTLAMVGGAERRSLLADWNQTERDYPAGSCLHTLFEAQAERTPNRTAVRCMERALTYRELNERSNRLAHALRRLGAGPDRMVGLCVDRSAEMLVGLLGILKSGSAYVPLSADHPKARLAQQLAGAVALVAEGKFLDQMPEFGGAVVSIGPDSNEWDREPSGNPEVQSGPENLAYVIYTSGSTGTPKGVAVRHRNLVNYSWYIQRLLDVEKHSEGLQFATVSTLGADLGNTCIYPSLISGGCVHVIPQDVSTDSQRLGAYTAAHPIDVLKIVPSHLAALLDSGEGAAVLPRKYLITGGEALTRRLMERIALLEPSCQIVNHYGPTETTVGSLTLPLRDYDWKSSLGQTVPIGRPIANTRIYILDAQQQLVPIGTPGELFIAGAGVTSGYLNQPELTAERFLPDPFASAGERMYRTGDLVRRLPDGTVEFLGRVDDQVKVRGFRIELGEIESSLAAHPSVRQAAVLAREDERGDKRLLAYVVAEKERAVDAAELRKFLAARLPDYMIPAAIVLLPKFPLNANGKIDRKALPAPEVAAPAGEPVDPRNPTETLIAGIWSEILRRDRIGIHDNFFEIGGHSLLATQVISRIRRTLEIDLPLRVLFESPTIASLSECIAQIPGTEPYLQSPPIVRVPREQPLALSFAQQRLWIANQLDPANPMYNIQRSLRMKGALNYEAFQKSLDEIFRRHESQRTTFQERDGQPVQVIADSAKIPLAKTDLSALAEPEREPALRDLAWREALLTFDLAQGPLVRTQLVQLAADDHVFLLTTHHIINDGWSSGIFMRELSLLYEAFSQGKQSPLPELTVQYADYAMWQRQWLQGEVMERQLGYWREALRGAPAVVDLPLDRPRSADASFEGVYELIWFSEETSKAVESLSRREDVTVFMTLLAGYQTLLSRYSGQEDIVIATDVANRTTTETEALIGFFVNLLPIRTNLTGNPTFRELLARIRKESLGAYAHQDVPFDKLVEELQPARSGAHHPIVQSLLVMQNLPQTRRQLAGLELSAFELPVTHSKFDLSLFLRQREGVIGGYWVYRTDLFDRSTILRMARQYENLLRCAASQPDTRIGSLEILSEEEKQKSEQERKTQKRMQASRLMATVPKSV